MYIERLQKFKGLPGLKGRAFDARTQLIGRSAPKPESLFLLKFQARNLRWFTGHGQYFHSCGMSFFLSVIEGFFLPLLRVNIWQVNRQSFDSGKHQAQLPPLQPNGNPLR